MGVRPLACWDCGLESRRRHGSLSLLSVVCYQVQVPVTGRSLVQSRPIECGVSECDLENLTRRRPWPTTADESRKNKGHYVRRVLHSVKTERQN